MSEEKSIVLLYYHFTSIEDPKALASEQRYLCQKLALKGRILIATEGINGTLGGSAAAAQAYQETMSGHPLFKGMEFKISEYATNPFGKLSVKVRKEIVTLGVDGPLDTRRGGGEHLSPAQWRQMIEEDPDVVLFDTRNRYESDIGKFKGAVCPDTENFRDLPEKISEYEHLKDKKWLMYCTGGIRCEKASVLFKEAGFQHVFQLHGGIVNYWKEIGDDLWEGDCFVFDERMSLKPPGAHAGDTPKGICVHTQEPTQNFINCLHDPCHKLILVHPHALEVDPQNQLCPECKAQGRTLETAHYKGSPSQPAKKTPKQRRNRQERRSGDIAASADAQGRQETQDA